MSQVRNIFDQYSQDENKLTHALACALASDHRSTRDFLATFLRLPRLSSYGRLEVVEQASHALSGKRKRAIPDLLIRDRNGRLGVAVECKVQAHTDPDQLHRHMKALAREEYGIRRVLLLSIDGKLSKAPDTKVARWKAVYEWAARQPRRPGSLLSEFRRFMEVFEAKTIKDGDVMPLTGFSGILFDDENPYNYPEAKARLRALIEALRDRPGDLRRIGASVSGSGRSAITGTGSRAVWDYIPVASAHGAFTASPHFTIAMMDSYLQVQITLPDKLAPALRGRLKELGEQGFEDMVRGMSSKIEKAVRDCPGAYPMMEMLQRHYSTQRSIPVVHAMVEFDLRTALPASGRHQKGQPKSQPQWLHASYEAFKNKRSNLQMAIGVRIPYSEKGTNRKALVDTIFKTWLGLGPLVRLLG